MKNLAYWKGKERDALSAYRQNGTQEFAKAWQFAIAKVKRLEIAAFKGKGVK